MSGVPGAPPAQGAPPPAAQPPASGQGEGGGQPTGDGSFNWGLFPNVPEEQRTLLEPHLRDSLGHVTRLEQQYAPFKPMLDSGMSAEQAQGLVQFAQNLAADPLQVWLGLGAELQQNKVLHEDLDLEEVTKAARGEPVEATPPEPGATPEGEQPWQGELQSMRQMIEDDRRQRQEEAQRRTDAVQDQLLDRHVTGIKTQLKEAGVQGVDEGNYDRLIVASIITNGGDPQKALGEMLGFRNQSLQDFTEQKQTGKPGLEMPRGAPKTTEKKATDRDVFDTANRGAESFLKSQNESAAQGR